MIKIGVQSAGWYNSEDPDSSFAYIKDCGFDAVDFNIDTFLSGSKLSKEGVFPSIFDKTTEELLDYFTPLKNASKKYDVEINQMHAPFPPYFKGLDEVNDYIFMALDKCFAVAEFLDCSAVVVHPIAGETSEEEWEITANFYRNLVPVIKKYKGVKICLENIFNRRPGRMIEGRLSNSYDACRMLDMLNEEAGGEYFGFCLDIGHTNLTGRNVKEYIKQLGSRLTILHIHDNNGSEDLHMIPYTYLSTTSSHVCDWQGFIDGLKEIGFDGVLSFETIRIFRVFPKPLHTGVMKLISAIGHYWKDELTKE
ncbi:MAG: sugar phosphate isomerase/epimerase [Ruminococcaceae bacterium]|nr:sugar phosphate isomerase/epimerase [Oscillospiraceae bacterium]